MKIYPHHPLCHIPSRKSQKECFAVQKSLRVLKLLRVLIDRACFRFFSYRVLLRVLSDRVLFESSVIGFSSGSSIIDSSLGKSVFFFRNVANFYQNMLLLFFIYIFSKRSSHLTISLTCFNDINKTDSKKIKKYLHDRDIKYYIEMYVINLLIYKLSILLNIQ